MQSKNASNQWTFLAGNVILGLSLYLIVLAGFAVFSRISGFLLFLFCIAAYVAFISISLGAAAFIYYGVVSQALDNQAATETKQAFECYQGWAF